MKKETLSKVQVILLCIAVAFLFLISTTANAQSSHNPILDNPKVKYYDLNGRLPYMKVALTCGSDAGNAANGTKIAVIPH